MAALPDLKELDAIVDWMRRRGVTRLSASVVRLELGPEPEKTEPEKALTEAEMEREGQKIAARRRAAADALDFAASEGFPLDFVPGDEPTWKPGEPH